LEGVAAVIKLQTVIQPVPNDEKSVSGFHTGVARQADGSGEKRERINISREVMPGT
jgi:hypothetical protein